MKLLYHAICDEATMEPDGKIHSRGLFHDLYAPGFPARQDQLTLVLVLEWDRGDEGRYDFKADLVDPEGNVALTVQGQSEITPRPDDRPPPRTQILMPMEGVIFPIPGEYTFQISAKGQNFTGPTLYLVETPEAAHGPVEA